MPFNRTTAPAAAGAVQPQRISTPATTPAAAQPARQLPATSMPRRAFSGVENAQVSRRGTYIQDGQYILQVQKVSYKEGRQKNMVIIETKVHTSSFDPADPTTHGCNKEGTDVSLYINENDNFLSTFKEFIIAASGPQTDGTMRALDDIVTEEECNLVISDQNPAAGAFIFVKVKQIKTKAGGDFTLVSYFPVPLDANKQPDLTQLG